MVGSPFLLDINILVYAFRDDAPEQERAMSWLRGTLDEGVAIAATDETLAAMIRLASHPRIVNRPNSEAAIEFCDLLLKAGLTPVAAGPGFWSIFRALCLRHGLAGNDVPDAHLAAIAIEQDATLVTHDRGFDRFAELRTLDPIAA